MDDMNRATDTAAERVAAPLREPERLSAGFEERLLSRVRAEVMEQAERKTEHKRSWWTRPRVSTRAPIVSLALAAGFTALVSLGTLAAVRSGPFANSFAGIAAPRTDTVHVVRFVYHDSAARQISVVGDFNGWGASEIPLQANGNGVWSVAVSLKPGAHEYAFVVDRDQWVADPAALSTRDEFGTPTSRLKLGAVDFTATE